MTTIVAALFVMTTFGALVDTDGNIMTNESFLADLDTAASTLGDLKDGIAPDYFNVSNKALNAVSDSMNAVTNANAMVDLVSEYGIATSVSNDLQQMSFFGYLFTNKFTIAYIDSAWSWNLYSGDSEDLIETGTIDYFSPLEDKTTTIELTSDATNIYGTSSIVFQTTTSQMTSSGVARITDLTTITYDDETDWMALYFKSYKGRNAQIVRSFPNSNQVQRIAGNVAKDIMPKKTSDLTNDLEFVDKSITNGLASKADIPVNVSQLNNDLDFTTSTQLTSAMNDVNANTTNVVVAAKDELKSFVTNTVVVGYTDYVYSGDIDPSTQYNVTIDYNEGSFIYTLWNMTTSAQLGTYSTNNIHATYVPFDVSGGTIYAACSEIRRNERGFAMYSDIKELENKIDTMDTSYLRTVGLTNKNQSVQYVYADENVTELQILMPESGMTKDWIVYVLAQTNVTLKLPPANYWCVSESVTNEIPGLMPTALYFSQINDDTYCIGRQELIPVTVQDESQQLMQAIRRKMKKIGR